MIINKLKVNRLKALLDHSINFSKITILAGGNSAGKSTTIQSLLFIRSIIENVKSKNLTDVKNQLNVPLNGPYMLSLGNTLEAISWEQGKSFTIEINDELKFDFQTSTLDEDTFFVNVNIPSLNNLQLSIVNNAFYYLNAERNGPRIRHWVNENPNNIHCGYRGEFTIDILARLGDNIEFEIKEEKFLKKKKVPGFQSLANHAQQWMDFIIPGVQISKAKIFGDIRSSSIKFDSFFSPPNVGFGVSYVLPIVVTGLLASSGSIFIVENPEAHLHPKGQSHIGYFLACMAGAGIQIIIETHSEHVINGVRLASLENEFINPGDIKVAFYSKDNESNSLTIKDIKTTDAGDLTSFPKDFFDQSQQDLLEIYNYSNPQNTVENYG